ncbi:hypothetical protein MMH89_02935 [Candidatus Comchoanobacter bicostacola]|uniref:Uncharacterized protein n=1 Tax=Candidatus Comchoanobacter bicostacola TaxID=2919598 RepID=A0ABY5DK44_9GAMM|nr:hypothetical protein [Candidatus Comchoanobacter bicostacola]UTC24177.1 hypothetical protein MMH89_02935 [Candidatus Comchoanobacter bicostacola]
MNYKTILTSVAFNRERHARQDALKGLCIIKNDRQQLVEEKYSGFFADNVELSIYFS